SASIRKNPITNSQRHVIVKENVSSNTVIASSTGLVHTAKTRRPQPKGNTRNGRVPSASKSSEVKKNVTVEDHRRTLLLSKNQKTMSSEWTSVTPHVDKPKLSAITLPSKKLHALMPSHSVPQLREFNVVKHRNVIAPIMFKINPSQMPRVDLVPNKQPRAVRFGNDHIDAILGYGNLKWGNITITRVYFVEGLGHNLFSVGQFCDVDLEVAFRRNTCFIKDLDGVDLLK
nr:integrase, catalytic region, zinc finger, CCHC-type, peptidase aspartic, catalytic [Tanacetum cinerariifolium]